MFGGVHGWGIHFLASETPIPLLAAEVLAARLPAAAAADLAEWGPEPTAQAQLATLLSHEIPVAEPLSILPEVPVLTDDRPFNEYFLLRRLSHPQEGGLRFPTGLAGMPAG